MRNLTKLLLLVSLATLMIGCTSTAKYDSTYVKEFTHVPKKLDGQALIYTSASEDASVITQNPSSFTGSATTLILPMGEMLWRIAESAFGDIFVGGADHSNNLSSAQSYSIIVRPSSTVFDYKYNQLKNAGLAVTPQVEVGIAVSVADSNGMVILDKSYSSGLVDGDTYFFGGQPAERINKAAHMLLGELMNEAARDTYNAINN